MINDTKKIKYSILKKYLEKLLLVSKYGNFPCSLKELKCNNIIDDSNIQVKKSLNKISIILIIFLSYHLG